MEKEQDHGFGSVWYQIIANLELLYEPSDFQSEGNHCYITYVGNKRVENEREETFDFADAISEAFIRSACCSASQNGV